MAKVYLVTEADTKDLLAAIDRDPKYGEQGGSSSVLSAEEQNAHDKAHRFFNYQIRRWLDKIKE